MISDKRPVEFTKKPIMETKLLWMGYRDGNLAPPTTPVMSEMSSRRSSAANAGLTSPKPNNPPCSSTSMNRSNQRPSSRQRIEKHIRESTADGVKHTKITEKGEWFQSCKKITIMIMTCFCK